MKAKKLLELNPMQIIKKDDYISKLSVMQVLQKAYAEGRISARDGCVSILDEINSLSGNVQPADRWISCNEQMPEDGISVLICSKRNIVSKATYESDMGYFYIADSEFHYNELDITHWQPLPNPPNGGDING